MSIKEFSKTSDVPLDFTGVCSIYGGEYHYKNGAIHNENGPAIIDSFGNKFWCFNGQFHRIDNAAIEYAGGRKEWYIDGQRYSKEEDFKNLFKLFNYIDDVPDNFTGIAKIQGCIYYYENGKHHRLNGPAIEFKDGAKCWYQNGKLHRLDGPAIKYASGTKRWYIGGIGYSEEEFNKKVASMNIKEFASIHDIPKDFTGICKAGNKTYHYKDGKLHREDGPAVEYASGHKCWWLNGKRHRTDGPAIEYSNGYKSWYLNGNLHREGGPAIEWADGQKEWYIEGTRYLEEDFNKKVANMKEKEIQEFEISSDVPNNFTGICKIKDKNTTRYYKDGKLHREDGAAIEYLSGDKRWFINDQLHRVDGPACEYSDGQKEWYVNGKRHRLDGPAMEYPNGTKHWYIGGISHSEEEFNKKVASMNIKEFSSIYDIPKNFNGVCKVGNETYHYKDGKYHREDGPAIEHANGRKDWYINNKRHREDGPAIEHADGSKEWFINGEYHREDGPACECANGYKSWYVNGKRHCLDGPATEYPNGTKRWYIGGIGYSEEEFNKKVASMNIKEFTSLHDIPKDFTGICKAGNKTYHYKEGEFHREDGPAIEHDNGNKEWFINGKYHREDGPACEWADGYKSWYQNGKRHRLDGPAMEWSNGRKEWYQNGVLHRLDGPAMEYPNGRKEWYINGKLHREDGPAIEHDNGDKVWYLNGLRHRTDGPAREYANGSKEWWLDNHLYDEKEFNYKMAEKHDVKKFKNYRQVPMNFTGICDINSVIHYYKEGAIHREDGPAIIYPDGLQKEWYLDNELHREDGPAIEWADGHKEWYQNNLLHREDGPAIEYADGSKEWYINGEFHRENGPAIESCNGDNAWYLRNKEYTKEDFDKILNLDKISNKDLNSESADQIQVVENTIQEKSKYDLMIKICNKASYRILSEQIVIGIIKSIKHGLSKISSLSVAEEIITSSVGKALVQAGIGIVLNKFDYNNEHIDKISEEMIISSISTLENSIFDSLIASIDFNEVQKQDTFVRIGEKANEQEFEIEINNNQQSLSIEQEFEIEINNNQQSLSI